MQSKIAILIAIIVGIIAVVLIHLYMQQSSVGEGRTITVLKAVKNLPRGTVVKKRYFEGEKILARDYSSRHHVTETRFKDIAGQKLTREYKKGDFLSIADVTSEAFVERPVPEEGRRFFLVQVSQLAGAAGLIRRGDHVDMVVVQRLSPSSRSGNSGRVGDAPGRVGTRGEDLKITVLRDVTVRDLGGRKFKQFGSEAGYYSTAVLDLSPAEAMVLAAIQNRATIVLLPRNRHEPPGKERIEMTMYATSLIEAIDKLEKELARGMPPSDRDDELPPPPLP